jgi:multicomponent Na+:H+ antiporter subunit D
MNESMMQDHISSMPALWMLLGAALIAVLPNRWRIIPAIVLPSITLWCIWFSTGDSWQTTVMGYSLAPFQSDSVRQIFGTAFVIAAMLSLVFGVTIASKTESSASMGYAGSAIGVAFAGDFLTFFVFWEMLAVFSTIIIWDGRTQAARAAGFRYALLHFMGGVVLLAGIAGLATQGDLIIRPLPLESLSAWLIFIGVLINAGAPPFSAWVADAYPEATPSGSVVLSAFTTKSAVLALILLFPGESVLISIGLVMIFYGIIYALLENDVRRILCYSIVNQVGFMVCAVGIGTDLALNGAVAHAFTHIIYKALLLMSAGAVIAQTGLRKCTDLGGLARSMPLTATFGIIGALAISAFPFTSGFVSKSLTSQAAIDAQLLAVWLALTAASAGVFLHAGIKFPWFVFFQKDSGLRPSDPHLSMKLAMGVLATLCIGIGCAPQLLYPYLPYTVTYVPYTTEHLVSQLQLLLFSGLAFFLTLPLMRRTLTLTLDFDWFYRVPLFRLSQLIRESVAQHGSTFRLASHTVIQSKVRVYVDKIFASVMLGGRSHAGSTVAIVTSALLIIVIISFVAFR